jgi:uncharacterized protein with HEPN domain
MPRDVRAYLADIVESCDAITSALAGVDVEAYQASRLVRSAVEREFTIIGEAVIVLSRQAPEVFERITQARRIVDFRNRLTPEYPSVSDVLVWGAADRDVAVLRLECRALLEELGD